MAPTTCRCLTISIFNCMSDDFLIFIANICGIKVGDDGASQIQLLNNAKTFENARVIQWGMRSHTQRRYTRGHGMHSGSQTGGRGKIDNQ